MHAVAGFFALGVLMVLGPRLGKYNPDGTANHLGGHNMPLTLVGLMLIYRGLLGLPDGLSVVSKRLDNQWRVGSNLWHTHDIVSTWF